MLPLIGDKQYQNGSTVVLSSYDDSILFTDKFIAQSQIIFWHGTDLNFEEEN